MCTCAITHNAGEFSKRCCYRDAGIVSPLENATNAGRNNGWRHPGVIRLFYYPIKNKTKQNRKKRKRWHQLLQKLRSNPSLRVFSVLNWSGRRKTWEGGCFICGPQEMFSWERNRCKQEKRLNTVIVWMAHKPNRGNIVVLSNLFSLVFTPSLLTVAWHSLALFKSFVHT